MKRFLALVLCVIMVCSLAACGAAEEPKTTEAAASNQEANATEAKAEREVIKVFYSADNIDESNVTVYDGARMAAEEINADESLPYRVELEIYSAKGDLTQQIADVETISLQEPDIVIISAADTDGILPAFKTAKEAGAFTVDLRGAKADYIDMNVKGSDIDAEVERIQEWVTSVLEADPDLVLNVGLIYGKASQPNGLPRCDAIKWLRDEKYPDRINILDEQFADWDVNLAMRVTEDWLQKYPEMNYICCANDIMARGAVNVLQAAGIKDKVLVNGGDNSVDGVQMVKDGILDMTQGTIRQEQGYFNFMTSLKGYLGEYTEKEYKFSSVYTVTKDTVDEFIEKRDNFANSTK